MSTDLKAIMARDERRRTMLNDPDLTGLSLPLDDPAVMRGWAAALLAAAQYLKETTGE